MNLQHEYRANKSLHWIFNPLRSVKTSKLKRSMHKIFIIDKGKREYYYYQYYILLEVQS